MLPTNMIAPSKSAAIWRLIGTPMASKVRPDEYKSRIAPPTKPRIAISAKKARYQVGSKVVSAPIGSIAIASLNFGSLPESAAP